MSNGEMLLAELAEVGAFRDEESEYVVYVHSRDTCQTPHIHIGDTVTYPRCDEFHCCVELQKLKYLRHSECDTCKLDETQLRKLIELLHSDDEDGEPVWRYILKTWNKNNPSYKISIDTPVPDYLKLLNY